MIKNLDHFTKNVLFVFAGTFLANFLNLIYQLLIAHKLSPVDFAAFNSLLAIFMLISNPLGTLQLALAKYSSEFSARNESGKVQALISGFFKKSLILAFLTLLIFIFFSIFIIDSLKINSPFSGHLLALLLAFSWLAPILTGGLQGLELFGWLVSSSLIGGIIKIVFTFLFIVLGFQISGALGGLLISTIFVIVVGFIPLKKFIISSPEVEKPDYKEILVYLFPVALSNMCFIWLVSFDMVLVKYFFSPEKAGVYSLAQMVGKIFLFLPGAISVVMFPKTSGLNAVNSDTKAILRKSLMFAFSLCLIASLVYNIIPGFILKVLTGKALFESITLGRLFSVSMTFYALTFVLINYFLSIKDLRFIKYLIVCVLLQLFAITLFHNNLFQIQSVLCVNSLLLFIISYLLVFYLPDRRGHPAD